MGPACCRAHFLLHYNIDNGLVGIFNLFVKVIQNTQNTFIEVIEVFIQKMNGSGETPTRIAKQPCPTGKRTTAVLINIPSLPINLSSLLSNSLLLPSFLFVYNSSCYDTNNKDTSYDLNRKIRTIAFFLIT